MPLQIGRKGPRRSYGIAGPTGHREALHRIGSSSMMDGWFMLRTMPSRRFEAAHHTPSFSPLPADLAHTYSGKGMMMLLLLLLLPEWFGPSFRLRVP